MDDMRNPTGVLDDFEASLHVSHGVRCSLAVLLGDAGCQLLVVSADERSEVEHVALSCWVRRELLRRGTLDHVR